MTNKINGIDVSECCFYNNGKCDNPNGMACNCINNAVCYFKELKRTRQINSELISKANAYDKLVILANDRLDIIDRLKQENEELKKQLEFSRTHKTVLDAERIKYKQALEEIREIAKFNQFYNPEKLLINGDIGQIQDLKMTEIYNKINEALNDRD